jgi:hypothetical protein
MQRAMILYHFTCAEYMDSILREGLNRGDVPTRWNSALSETNGVWFTTEPTPEGHGLAEAHVYTDEERRAYYRCFGAMPAKGSGVADKRAVRIRVVIPSSDRRLVPWSKWGRKHCEPGLYDALAKGNRPKTWFVYFGVIAPDRFTEIKYLNSVTMAA